MWVSATWERHQKKQRHLWLHQINPLTPALPDLFPPSSSASLGDEIPCRDCICAISPSLIWKCGRTAQGCDGYLLSVLSLHACWLCKSLLWDHTSDHAGVVPNSFYLSVSSLMPADNGDIGDNFWLLSSWSSGGYWGWTTQGSNPAAVTRIRCVSLPKL